MRESIADNHIMLEKTLQPYPMAYALYDAKTEHWDKMRTAVSVYGRRLYAQNNNNISKAKQMEYLCWANIMEIVRGLRFQKNTPVQKFDFTVTAISTSHFHYVRG